MALLTEGGRRLRNEGGKSSAKRTSENSPPIHRWDRELERLCEPEKRTFGYLLGACL